MTTKINPILHLQTSAPSTLNTWLSGNQSPPNKKSTVVRSQVLHKKIKTIQLQLDSAQVRIKTLRRDKKKLSKQVDSLKAEKAKIDTQLNWKNLELKRIVKQMKATAQNDLWALKHKLYKKNQTMQSELEQMQLPQFDMQDPEINQALERVYDLESSIQESLQKFDKESGQMSAARDYLDSSFDTIALLIEESKAQKEIISDLNLFKTRTVYKLRAEQEQFRASMFEQQQQQQQQHQLALSASKTSLLEVDTTEQEHKDCVDRSRHQSEMQLLRTEVEKYMALLKDANKSIADLNATNFDLQQEIETVNYEVSLLEDQKNLPSLENINSMEPHDAYHHRRTSSVMSASISIIGDFSVQDTLRATNLDQMERIFALETDVEQLQRDCIMKKCESEAQAVQISTLESVKKSLLEQNALLEEQVQSQQVIINELNKKIERRNHFISKGKSNKSRRFSKRHVGN